MLVSWGWLKKTVEALGVTDDVLIERIDVVDMDHPQSPVPCCQIAIRREGITQLWLCELEPPAPR